ncbi:hypothetical protein ABZS61_11755 [Streptomyces sp. NPDC005566]|uniref:hypothetical protein n=1 Tax=Streptomyces sp. NPDC005566 TaxID=3156886 RepID=UPI0033A41A01
MVAPPAHDGLVCRQKAAHPPVVTMSDHRGAAAPERRFTAALVTTRVTLREDARRPVFSCALTGGWAACHCGA